ncbi:MAG TPA: hypothetical protein VG345_09375 [Bryobacteraceae bacterium]|jgi:hypothetical protein|nr:hypothetical protein [Bryobacteraceae bacterium]
MKRAILLAVAAISAAGLSFAADLSGIWTGQTVDRNGDPQDVSFRLTQNGDAVAGKMYGENESTPISEGKITGDTIRFVVVTELNGQVNRTVYSGHILNAEGTQIEVTREREGRPANTQKTPQKKEPPIRLHRVA